MRRLLTHPFRPGLLLVLAVLGPVCAACASPAASPEQTPPSSPAVAPTGPTAAPTGPTVAPSPSAVPSAAPSHSPSPTPSPASPTPSTFTASVSPVTAAELGGSWHSGCPVPPSALSQITMSYWGFDAKPHTGELVMATSVVSSIETVFRTLFNEHFPIYQMQPISVYGGSDPDSTAADNTAGFNCRDAVAPGPPQWSQHAYGLAVDVNTVQNPYLEGGAVQPPNGAPYVNRSDVRPGMAVPGGQLVDAFTSIGWGWGGNWAGTPDYQHFSQNGH